MRSPDCEIKMAIDFRRTALTHSRYGQAHFILVMGKTIQVIHLGRAILRYKWRYPIITGVVDKPIALFFKDCQSWLNSYGYGID